MTLIKQPSLYFIETSIISWWIGGTKGGKGEGLKRIKGRQNEIKQK